MVKGLIATLACCGLLSLSACSDDSSSSADPPTPTTSSSEPTTSPTEEAETPEEFVRRWVDVDREMQNTGETAEYRNLTMGCAACKGVADQIDSIYEAGGYVMTNGLRVRAVHAGEPDDNGEVEVRLDVRSTPTKYVETAGGPIQTLPGGPVTYLLTLHEAKNSWLLVLLERLAE